MKKKRAMEQRAACRLPQDLFDRINKLATYDQPASFILRRCLELGLPVLEQRSAVGMFPPVGTTSPRCDQQA